MAETMYKNMQVVPEDLSDQRGESVGVPEKNEAESRRRE